jgi:dTDP-D-glucose 4,6-dehydratase
VGAIPAFIKKISQGEKIQITESFRDYLIPEDFIFAIKQILKSVSLPNVLVIGSSKATETKDLLFGVADALEVQKSSINYEVIESKASDPKQIVLDSRVAQERLQMKFSENYDKAVAATVRQFLLDSPEVRLHH